MLLKKILIALAATLIIVYFYPHPEANRYNYEEGRPWNYSKLIAPFDIPVHPDSATIIAARDSLSARFVPIFELNQLIIDTIVSRLPEAPGTNLQRRLGAELRKIYSSGMVDMRTREEIEQGRLPKVRILNKNVLSEMSTSAFTSPRDAYVYLDSVITDPELHQYFLRSNLQNLLLPNYTRNEEECRRNYEYEYLTITADRGIILQGQTIIDKGAIVSSQDFTNLHTYESMVREQLRGTGTSDTLMVAGRALYVLLCLSMLAAYFHFFCPAVSDNPRAYMFVMLLVLVFFVLSALLERNVALGIYLVPVAVVAVLIFLEASGIL